MTAKSCRPTCRPLAGKFPQQMSLPYIGLRFNFKLPANSLAHSRSASKGGTPRWAFLNQAGLGQIWVWVGYWQTLSRSSGWYGGPAGEVVHVPLPAAGDAVAGVP